jgi:hypothetical protein
VASRFGRPKPRAREGSHLPVFRVAVFWLALLTTGTGLGGDGLPGNRTADHLATQKRRTDTPQAYAPIDYAWVAKLPTLEISTASDLVAINDVEQHAVALAGYIVRVIPVPAQLAARRATEWEFQVHLRLGPPERCEYRDDPRNVVAVVTPRFQPPHTGWDFDVLSELCREHTRVRISGWLLYDYLSRAQVGRSRVSPWAIHPVTQIEVWDARDGSWERLR